MKIYQYNYDEYLETVRETVLEVKGIKFDYCIVEQHCARLVISLKKLNLVIQDSVVFLPKTCYLIQRITKREMDILKDFWSKQQGMWSG